jgi:hypothetical protein
VPLVCLRRAHITGGDLPSAVGGMPVKDFVLGGLTVKVKGRVVWFEKFQGPTRKMDLTPFECLSNNLQNPYKIVEKSKNCKPHFLCSV